MATPFNLEIVTPEKHFFTGEVDTVIMTTIDGEIGVLAKHVTCVAAINPSPMRFQTSEGWKVASIGGGFAMIGTEGVTVLADVIEWPEEIDAKRAEEAKKRAEERLASQADDIDTARAQIALLRAVSRLKVAGMK